MNLIDYVILAIIAAIIGLSIFAVYRSKKKGNACIGCPDSAHCAAAKSGGCSHNTKS